MQLAALALALLAQAGAAPLAGSDNPLAAFPDYGHPEVTADNCQSKDPGHTTCYIPAKTMGRYLVTVRGKATASSPDAVEAISIGGPGWACGEAQSKKGEWTSGERIFIARCEVTVLNDTPLQIDAQFAGPGATLDPKGPVVTIRRLPWSGVLETSGLQAGIAAPQAAGGGDKPPAPPP